MSRSEDDNSYHVDKCLLIFQAIIEKYIDILSTVKCASKPLGFEPANDSADMSIEVNMA